MCRPHPWQHLQPHTIPGVGWPGQQGGSLRKVLAAENVTLSHFIYYFNNFIRVMHTIINVAQRPNCPAHFIMCPNIPGPPPKGSHCWLLQPPSWYFLPSFPSEGVLLHVSAVASSADFL